ncbi:hypothetical protein EJ110_NYTH19479 [Nymphaea thermarum]|nr:hypothetical protein EJ110_NYTH19479 [Nymphaea thermarum]
MWNSLRQTYSQDKNISKILQVQQELLQMQQGDLDSTEYFTKLKFTYENMSSLKPPCKHCLKSHMEQMIGVKFLVGLSSDYSTAKAQMLPGSDFPDLDEAFNRLNRLAVTLLSSSNNSQPSALASFGGGRSGLYSSRDSTNQRAVEKGKKKETRGKRKKKEEEGNERKEEEEEEDKRGEKEREVDHG